MASEARIHWEDTYVRKAPDQMTWFEEVPRSSLALIERSAVDRHAAVIDVGGGAARLAKELVGRGYTDVTVADISAAALEQARSDMDMGPDTDAVSWVEADLRDHDFGRQFDVWHDRAVFHFMVDESDRAGYLTTLSRSLRPDGHLILATFGPAGPTQCSGLPVQRYGADQLAAALGDAWKLESSDPQLHTTPSGNEQQFQYTLFRRSPA